MVASHVWFVVHYSRRSKLCWWKGGKDQFVGIIAYVLAFESERDAGLCPCGLDENVKSLLISRALLGRMPVVILSSADVPDTYFIKRYGG